MSARPPSHRNFDEEPPDGYVHWATPFEQWWACFDLYAAPGIGHEIRNEWHGYQVDVLKFHNDAGLLVGIFCQYSKKTGEAPEYLFPGLFEILVRPEAQGKQIGTQLLLEAVRRFGTDLGRQHYTRAGYKLARRVRNILRRHPAYAARETANAGISLQNENAKQSLQMYGKLPWS